MRRLNIATKNERYTTNVIPLKALAEQLGMDLFSVIRVSL
jgi:hypothetical protein